MKTKKIFRIFLILSIIIFLSGLVGVYSEELKICTENSLCANKMFYGYGRPVVQLFSIIVSFLIPLSLFSDRFISYWTPRILWSLPLPIIFTFTTPMHCSGFLGCIPSRGGMAVATGLLWVGILIVAMIVKSIAWKKQTHKI